MDSEEDYQEERGWRYPGSIDIPEETWYRIPYGDNVTKDHKWEGHVDMAHQYADESVEFESEVVDSGFGPDGIKFAVVRATVRVDGETYQAIQGADETSTQVRDPEFVHAVAESRALKRAVKKALNIMPVSEDTAASDPVEPQSPDPEEDAIDAVDIDPENEEVAIESNPEGEW